MTANPVAGQVYDEARGWHEPTDTDVLDLTVIAETVKFTPLPPERAVGDFRSAARWVPPLGRVRVDPHEPTPVFAAVEAGWRWRTRTGRASPKRRTWAAYVAECRADTAAVTAAVATYWGRR